MEPHDISKYMYPLQVVATDLFYYYNDFAIVVGYYSTYFEIFTLHNPKSVSVINKLKCIFSMFGIPETLY